MFEIVRIKIFGGQPIAKVTDKKLDQLIQREFGGRAPEIKRKLQQVTSDTGDGKNRISAAILKCSNGDFKAIDHFIATSSEDFRDVISNAEYPRFSKLSVKHTEGQNMKRIYLEDWREYSNWLKK